MNNIGAYGTVSMTNAPVANEDLKSSRKTVDGTISETKASERKSADSLEISEEGKSSALKAAELAKAQTKEALEKLIRQQFDIFKQTSTKGAKPLKNVNFADLDNDDYYGVDATANRMFSAAVKMSGGSPEKMAQFKELTVRAYAEAEKQWGGSLPAICYKTRDKLYSMFDNYIESDGATTESLDET